MNDDKFIKEILSKLIRNNAELMIYIEMSKDTGFTNDAVQHLEMAIEDLKESLE